MKKFMIDKCAMGIAVIVLGIFLSGCGDRTEKWAYVHDPLEEVISLSEDGSCTYKGNRYTYTMNDTFINLKGEDGSVTSLRYEMNGEQMTLYEESTYSLEGEDTDSIVGVWKQDNGWSYQFTENGEFSEENIFHGHYLLDEKNGCIKLMYDDPIEDAYLYYVLNGDELTVAYPWPMVRVN